jgi:MHS family proline/betaine transporter-like MFS transporter
MNQLTTSTLKTRSIIASITGNIIEWYDFSLYLYLAPVIAHNFFPKENKLMSLLLTFLVFAMGFVLRPLGSILFGHFGDSIGRARTLKITILLTALSAICIALLPTYQTIGMLAPIALTLLRMLQGLCISGEFAGSMIYLTESAPSKKRALISCMTNNGSNFGIVLATSIAALLAVCMPVNIFNTYGWRLLFLLGGLIGLFGLWLRNDIQESDVFKKIKEKTNLKAPLLTLMRNQKRNVLYVFLLLIMSASGCYVLMGYLTTYLHVYLHFTMAKALQIQALFNMISLFVVTMFAIISDRYGRRFTLYIAAFGYIILSIPCFYYLQSTGLWICLLPLVIVYSAEQATTPVTMVEMFPGATRYSGVSIGYNLSMAIVGGTAPLVNTWLISTFNNTMMIAYYLMVCAVISLMIVMFKLPKVFGQRLELT